MTKIGIVGSGYNKFDNVSKVTAIEAVKEIVKRHVGAEIVSGGSHLGGIDTWADCAALQFGRVMNVKKPDTLEWNPPEKYGYRARNIDIAVESDELYVIVPESYPDTYRGTRYPSCYHCEKHPGKIPKHIKSGGCWTGWYAHYAGKNVTWIVIKGDRISSITTIEGA